MNSIETLKELSRQGKLIELGRYEEVICHTNGKSDGEYWLIEGDSKKGYRETIFNKETGEIIEEKYF